MLYRPVRSKVFVAEENRPALISVVQGAPRASSLKSMLKSPDALASSARTARAHTAATRRSKDVLPRAAIEETSDGWPPVPRYDRRSYDLRSTRVPSFQRLWQPKSRPGRYSERAKAVARMPRSSRQNVIQRQACSALRTRIAPRAPAPLRIRHHARARGGRRRKMRTTLFESVTR